MGISYSWQQQAMRKFKRIYDIFGTFITDKFNWAFFYQIQTSQPPIANKRNEQVDEAGGWFLSFSSVLRSFLSFF